MGRERSNSAVVNIPNILTLVRLLLTPLFVILLLGDQLGMALSVFILAALSDGLDGLIARCFNQQTDLGAYLDPVADKAMLVSAFVCLAVLKIIPGWLAVIVLSRDILIVIGIAILTLTEKRYQIRPSRVSKWTTAVQFVVISVSLLLPVLPVLDSVQPPLVWLTAGLTMVSGFHYIYLGGRMLQTEETGVLKATGKGDLE